MAMLVPEKARVQAGPVFDSRQHEAGTLKEHFSVSRTYVRARYQGLFD